MNVVYMGTPDFAVLPLKALIENGYNVTGVITQPDKPVGRKAILTPPPVKTVAVENGIPVFQPCTLKNGEGVKILRELKPDVVIVVAYGKILPADFLEFPKYGCINIHGSVLPKYRGAAPIQWSVLNGDEYSGVTSMQLNEGLDTGDMLICEKLKIGEDETSGELYERLSPLGASVLLKTLDLLKSDALSPVKQNDSESSYASMLDKSMSPVDWSLSSSEIHNKIRGLDPWPVASTLLNGKTLKLFKSHITGEKSQKCAGSVITDKNGLKVVCGDGVCISISEVQYEGKKRMSSVDFFRGFKTDSDTVLGNC